MIFDEVAQVMNADTDRVMSKKTGLSRDKVRRLTNGLPFVLDYNTCYALQNLGYEIKLERKK